MESRRKKEIRIRLVAGNEGTAEAPIRRSARVMIQSLPNDRCAAHAFWPTSAMLNKKAIAEDKEGHSDLAPPGTYSFERILKLHVSRLLQRPLRPKLAFSTDALRELATLQAASTSVRKEIGPIGVGWEVMIR